LTDNRSQVFNSAPTRLQRAVLSVVYNDKYSLSSEDDSIETEIKYELQTQNHKPLVANEGEFETIHATVSASNND